MKRKKKHKTPQGGPMPTQKRIETLLAREFRGVPAVQLVTLTYDERYQDRAEEFYTGTVNHWKHGVMLACRHAGQPFRYLLDMDWEEGAGAPVHLVVVERDVNPLQMARLWVYGTVTAEPQSLTQGYEALAARLMGCPAAKCGW